MKPNEKRIDFLALGARVTRLDPGVTPLHAARNFAVHVSGGEYNVAFNLLRCFQRKTGIVTASVSGHPMGRLVDEATPHGMSTFTREFMHNGVDGPNIATVYSDTGFGIRGPKVFYNRANEAAALLQPGDFDFDRIFDEHDVRWVHSGGIFASLSESTAKLVFEFLSKAKARGIRTSFDLNFRAKLWARQGGKEAAVKQLRPIAEVVDVMVGNEEDLQLGLGLKGPDVEKQSMGTAAFKQMVEQLREQFPSVKVVATTLRDVHSALRHSWGMVLYMPGEVSGQDFFEAPVMQLDVLCRIGGGDGAASGLFHCLLEGKAPEWATKLGWSYPEYCVRMAAAHGALLTTTAGDTTNVGLEDVIQVAKGGSARVAR